MFMKILLTGAAGFIGSHLSLRLLKENHYVVGLDNLNDYYDVQLKRDRLARLGGDDNFRFVQLDLADTEGMKSLFGKHHFDRVINLAAQAGVRYSIENPHAYVESHVLGFLNILEGCRHGKVDHLIFASSSSVYGLNTLMPFAVHHNVDHPISLYAATKKANELMAHTYSYLYGVPASGLRFFTVYGPWGRPDMALFLFTDAIINDKPIKVFNNGHMKRDFTYISDIVEGIVRVMDKVPESNMRWTGNRPDPSTSIAPYHLYNIGNNHPISLMEFINTIEDALGKKAVKEFLPLQPGDVPETYADVDDLIAEVGFKPETSIQEGVSAFISWYKEYYGVD